MSEERNVKHAVKDTDHKIVYNVERVRHGINNFFNDIGNAVKKESNTGTTKMSSEAERTESAGKL